MKENDVASISEQFGLDKEIVEASINDGTLGQRIKDSLKDKVIYPKEDFETFKKNYSTEVTNSYFTDLVEKAKKADIPQDLYAPIKGAAYQQLERELAKELNIEDYRDVRDLIQKAVKSSANGKPNEEYERLINELKTANTKLKEEKESATQTVEQKWRDITLQKEKSSLLNSVPFDFSNVKSDELETVRSKTQNLLKGVFEQEYKLDFEGDRLVVKKGDEILKNEATREPVPAKDVFVSLAKEYNLKLQSPDSGGQGGKSSASSTAAYASVEAFEEDMRNKGIPTTSKEYIQKWSESGLSNVKK